MFLVAKRLDKAWIRQYNKLLHTQTQMQAPQPNLG